MLKIEFWIQDLTKEKLSQKISHTANKEDLSMCGVLILLFKEKK